MYDKLTPNIKALIYEYDQTYRDKFNIVLEEFKIWRLLKFVPEYNLTETINWGRRMRKTEPNQHSTIIQFNKNI